MQEPAERKLGTPLSENEAEQYFRLREMLFEFARLFEYAEPNDRAIAIVGPAFLDTLLTEILINFLVDDENEIQRLMQPEGPLGTFGAKVSACYCLGLIGETVKSDLRLVAKIRNRFAHDLRVISPTSRSTAGATCFDGIKNRFFVSHRVAPPRETYFRLESISWFVISTVW